MNETASEVLDNVNLTFGKADMIIFIVLLAVSLGIGVYFSWCGKKSNTTEEYLLAERKLNVLPAAISILASKVSATSVMLLPTEIYTFGFQYILVLIGMFFAILVMIHIVAPVYYATINRNCYEYLEMRFDAKTRQLATVSFLVTVYLLMPVVIFIPSLAFSQVSGMNIHLINGIVCGICVFYTMLGGIKAVVWTDFVQGIIIMLSLFMIAGTGVYKIGGLYELFSRAAAGGRLHIFDFTLDFTTRATFWNLLFGTSVVWFAFLGMNQSCVQRIIALPSLDHGRKVLWIFFFGFCVITGLCCFNGIVMYGKYYSCDPLATGQVKKTDKLMPFFVQDILGGIPGMAGLFISCVFSAGLSTMSANIHSMSGVVYFDYIRPFIKHTEAKANYIMKVLVLVTGIYCIVAGMVVEKFASIFQMVITVSSVTQGTMVGLFTLGMLYPRANAKSAFIGSVISLAVMGWIIIGAQVKATQGLLQYDTLPTRTDGCAAYNVTTVPEHFITLTSTLRPPHLDSEVSPVFKLSFMWFALFGAVLVWIIAVPLSFITEKNDLSKLNPNLISPIAQFLIPEEFRHKEVPQKEELKNGELSLVEK